MASSNPAQELGLIRNIKYLPKSWRYFDADEVTHYIKIKKLDYDPISSY